jgi:hypothetical protein
MPLHILVDQLLEVVAGAPKRPDYNVGADPLVSRQVAVGILELKVSDRVNRPFVGLRVRGGDDLGSRAALRMRV